MKTCFAKMKENAYQQALRFDIHNIVQLYENYTAASAGLTATKLL